MERNFKWDDDACERIDQICPIQLAEELAPEPQLASMELFGAWPAPLDL
jgi:hypothetical protein